MPPHRYTILAAICLAALVLPMSFTGGARNGGRAVLGSRA